MLAFAIVFSLMVENGVLRGLIGASLAWLAVSVTAWSVRRKLRWLRQTARGTGGPEIPRSRHN
jgi:hypothetical protein